MLPRKRTGGLTLVELIVVVVILSLVMVIGAGGLDGLLPKYRMRGATRAVGFLISQARGEAMAAGKDVYVVYELSATPQAVYAMVPQAPEGLGDEKEPELSVAPKRTPYMRAFEQAMPAGVAIRNVIIGRSDVRTSGKVTLRFSPFGAQPSHLVNLEDENRRPFGIKWNGLTGVATYAEREFTPQDLRYEPD